MEPADFIELARTIILGYGGFKLTELMVFFQRFKQDKYDQFFGTFTPGTVTRSLKKFNSDRENLLRFYEDKKGRRKRNGNGNEAEPPASPSRNGKSSNGCLTWDMK